MKQSKLLQKLLLGILFGIVFGLTTNLLANAGFIYTLMFFIARCFATFNKIFGAFLSFMIPLVILTFVSVALAQLGKNANKLFLITLALAYSSSLVAGFIGFFTGSIFIPMFLKDVIITPETLNGITVAPLFTLEMPVVFGVMTALILSFVLGLGMANIKGDTLFKALNDAQKIVTAVLSKIIIPLIPVHIAGLFMTITIEGALFNTITLFIVLFALIVIVQLCYVLAQFLAAKSYVHFDLIQTIKNISPAYFTALGTQSSAATIPVSLDCAKKNGISNEIAEFTIPLMATIHLAGDTITLVLGAMGIMYINGIDYSFVSFLPYMLMLGVTMVAAPGIPGGGVMAALGLLTDMLGFTPAMQNLMITLHFSQDSFGTATNVSGDQALSLIINKYSREKLNIK